MAHAVSQVDLFLEALLEDHMKHPNVRAALQSGYERAHDEGRTLHVVTQSESSDFPHELCDVINSLSSDVTYFYWSPHKDSSIVLAIGCAAEIVVDSSEDVHGIQQAMGEVAILSEFDDGTQWYGGLAFADANRRHPWANWPFGQFFLPLVKFINRGNGTLGVTITWEITGAIRPDEIIHTYTDKVKSLFIADSRPANIGALGPVSEYSLMKQDYLHVVETIAEEIQMKQYDKAVVARYESISVSPSDVTNAIIHLRADYPTAFVFAFKHGGDVFLGGTPERLVRVENQIVFVDCLAGTFPRGKTRGQDEELGNQLLESKKNLSEHRAVVNWITSSLRPFVDSLSVPEGPVLKRLTNVQHLYTPVTGRLNENVTILDLVGQLHPTPAVAGVPREAALRAIAAHENMDRGWYAGPIGWVDQRGSGEFAVALRSGLVKESGIAYVFAGGGIMGDSDAEVEWLETNLKLIPMKSAFEN